MGDPRDVQTIADLRIMLASANDECAAAKAQLLGATASNEGLRKERAELQGVIARARAEVRAFQEQAASTAPEIERRLDDVDDALMGAYGYTRGDAEWEKLTTDLAACTALLEERTRERDAAWADFANACDVGRRLEGRADSALARAASLESENAGLRERVRRQHQALLHAMRVGYSSDLLDAALSDAPPAGTVKEERVPCGTCEMWRKDPDPDEPCIQCKRVSNTNTCVPGYCHQCAHNVRIAPPASKAAP